MSSKYTLPEWVTPTLSAIEMHLHEHGAEVASLRASGIAERRVNSLYPFEPEAYYAGVRSLFASGVAHAALPQVFSFANVYQTVATQLPLAEQTLCSALRAYRDEVPEGIRNLTTKKLLFDNVLQLPLVLRILRERYPFGEKSNWLRPHDGPALLAASLPLLAGVSEEFAQYLDEHMPPRGTE